MLYKYILEKSKLYNLDDITYQTYVKQIDARTQLNATDVVHAISSILESPHYVLKEVTKEELQPEEILYDAQ